MDWSGFGAGKVCLRFGSGRVGKARGRLGLGRQVGMGLWTRL